jgi:hypothetical protein
VTEVEHALAVHACAGLRLPPRVPEWFRAYLAACLRRHSAGLALRVHLMPETGLLALYAHIRDRLAPPWSTVERVTPESLAALIVRELRHVGQWSRRSVERIADVLREELEAGEAPAGGAGYAPRREVNVPSNAAESRGSTGLGR